MVNGTYELFGRRRTEAELVALSFDASRLTQARVLARLSKTDLAKMAELSAAAIGQFEAGVTPPRPETVERLASILNVRPRFLASGRPIALPAELNAHFRSLRGTRTRDRAYALAIAGQVWELVAALERRVEFPPVDLPIIPEGAGAEQAASALRRHWGVPEGPIRHLTALAESRGIVVVARPPGAIDAIDAFSIMVNQRPVVLTTPRQSDDVQRHRFTVAHELGHLMLHTEALPGDLQQEAEADAFAAHFLTPAEQIAGQLPDRIRLPILDIVSATWGVSVESLLRRMRELGRTTDGSVRRAYQRLAVLAPMRVTEPTSAFAGETATLLSDAVAQAGELGVSTGQLVDELGWTTERLVDLARIPDLRPALRIVGYAE